MKKVSFLAICASLCATMFFAGSLANGGDSTSYNPTSITVKAINTGTPVGTIIAWPSKTDPKDADKWLECDGRAVDQNTYPLLYAMMHNTPDFRGRFLRGKDSTHSILQNVEDTIKTHDSIVAEHTHSIAGTGQSTGGISGTASAQVFTGKKTTFGIDSGSTAAAQTFTGQKTTFGIDSGSKAAAQTFTGKATTFNIDSGSKAAGQDLSSGIAKGQNYTGIVDNGKSQTRIIGTAASSDGSIAATVYLVGANNEITALTDMHNATGKGWIGLASGNDERVIDFQGTSSAKKDTVNLCTKYESTMKSSYNELVNKAKDTSADFYYTYSNSSIQVTTSANIVIKNGDYVRITTAAGTYVLVSYHQFVNLVGTRYKATNSTLYIKEDKIDYIKSNPEQLASSSFRVLDANNRYGNTECRTVSSGYNSYYVNERCLFYKDSTSAFDTASVRMSNEFNEMYSKNIGTCYFSQALSSTNNYSSKTLTLPDATLSGTAKASAVTGSASGTPLGKNAASAVTGSASGTPLGKNAASAVTGSASGTPLGKNAASAVTGSASGTPLGKNAASAVTGSASGTPLGSNAPSSVSGSYSGTVSPGTMKATSPGQLTATYTGGTETAPKHTYVRYLIRAAQ
ncbi:MAG: tail fiber protein [Lachnospiraceae bacterium]|nr:tail fiber protein [Lachnospiraceae bacterium]